MQTQFPPLIAMVAFEVLTESQSLIWWLITYVEFGCAAVDLKWENKIPWAKSFQRGTTTAITSYIILENVKN